MFQPVTKVCYDCARSNNGNPCYLYNTLLRNEDHKQCPSYMCEFSFTKRIGSCKNCRRNSKTDPCHFKRQEENKELCDHFIGRAIEKHSKD